MKKQPKAPSKKLAPKKHTTPAAPQPVTVAKAKAETSPAPALPDFVPTEFDPSGSLLAGFRQFLATRMPVNGVEMSGAQVLVLHTTNCMLRKLAKGRMTNVETGLLADLMDRTDGKPVQQFKDLTDEFKDRTTEELNYYAAHGVWPEETKKK